MKIFTLLPEHDMEFVTALHQAWTWARRRKRFYCDRGGYQTLSDYLHDAMADDTKQLAVTDDGQMVAVITVQLAYENIYQVHVTAAPKTPARIVREALLQVRSDLFDKLNAREIWTSCGTHRGHANAASYAMAEACGMTPSGIEWQSATDPQTVWQEFCITRESYGRTKSDD